MLTTAIAAASAASTVAALALAATAAANQGDVNSAVIGGAGALGGGALVGWVVWYLLAKHIPRQEESHKAERMQLSEQSHQDRNAAMHAFMNLMERSNATIAELAQQHRQEIGAFRAEVVKALDATAKAMQELAAEIRASRTSSGA